MEDNNDQALVATGGSGGGGDPQSDDEENYYENPLEVIREFGNNPLMERAQKALKAQLDDINFKLKTTLYEKSEELKRITNDRETVGVALYSLQQQLARIQVMLENTSLEYNNIVDGRLAEEDLLASITKNNLEQSNLLTEYKKQHKKNATELERLNETIQQIEKYNEEIKSEILVTKNMAFKTESNLQTLEVIKQKQDEYVDSLNIQIKSTKEQISSLKEQFELQKKDTNDAQSVLQDTIHELDLISIEKKQIMTQWKSTLTGLSRRDEALAQATITLQNAESAVHDYDVEIESCRRDLQKEQAKHETLVSLRDRLENELHWVDDNLAKIKAERDLLQERFTLLNKSLLQTDHESKKLDNITKSLKNDSDSLISNLQIVTQERQKMEEELQLMYSNQSNVNKAINNLMKDQMKILKKIHEKENEGNEVENEIARTKVDRLNLNNTTDQLKEQLAVHVKDVKEKEALIAKYQLEIRQRNDEVEKKMYRVDRLNKKYEKMVESAGGEENLGPLENTIKNLNKEIDNTLLECKELEREWLKKQTDMVTQSAECDGIAEKNTEQQARVTILTQQQLRLNNDLREIKNNLKVTKQINIDLQKDVSKLNALISVNHEAENSLQGANFIIEKECVEELKETEKECMSIQAAINDTKTQKLGLLDQIMEQERQALLWEKKIQLDKETREALDPSVGVQETENMEKEIHRMELR
eukprot:gene11107-14909_t